MTEDDDINQHITNFIAHDCKMTQTKQHRYEQLATSLRNMMGEANITVDQPACRAMLILTRLLMEETEDIHVYPQDDVPATEVTRIVNKIVRETVDQVLEDGAHIVQELWKGAGL